MKKIFIFFVVLLFSFPLVLGSAQTVIPAPIYSPVLELKKNEWVKEVMTDIKKEKSCLAKNIYFEARNEPFAGQFAVALVTLNRVSNKNFPDTICEVVFEGLHYASGIPKKHKCQFSWYCDGELDVVKNKSAMKTANKIAQLAMVSYNSIKEQGLDYTENAMFYHTFEVNPYWAKSFPKVGRIGDHIFYR
jgi:N-acetylmuramoyl-L-alanine amidase